MSWLSTILTCAMLAASVELLRADPPEAKEPRKTNGVSSKSESEKRREQFKNMTPEERVAKRKEIKGRLEKRIVELRAKQASGTITAQEMRELERREKILKHFEQEDSGAPRIERAKPVFTNSPAPR